MRLPRRLSIALLASLLAACAGRVPLVATSNGVAPAEPGPLVARLLPPTGRTLWLQLSEPAYVTVFEIVPGRGTSIVYPAAYDAAATKPLSAGSHFVNAVPVNVGRWFYENVPAAQPGPTYLYLVASRKPLRTAEVLREPARLRRVVGFASFSRADGMRMMDVLDERFVPAHLSDDDWTSDWLAIWPDPLRESRRMESAALHVVQCGDGHVYVGVRPSELSSVCGRRGLKRVEPQAPKPPGDSGATPARPSPAPPEDAPRVPRRPEERRAHPMTLVMDYGTPDDAGTPPRQARDDGRAALDRRPATAPGEHARRREPAPWERRGSVPPPVDETGTRRVSAEADRHAGAASSRADARAESRGESRRDGGTGAPAAASGRGVAADRAPATTRAQ